MQKTATMPCNSDSTHYNSINGLLAYAAISIILMQVRDNGGFLPNTSISVIDVDGL